MSLLNSAEYDVAVSNFGTSLHPMLCDPRDCDILRLNFLDPGFWDRLKRGQKWGAQTWVPRGWKLEIRYQWFMPVGTPALWFAPWFLVSTLSGWWFEPLWKIWKSIGMIRNPIYGKIKNGNQSPPTSYGNQAWFAGKFPQSFDEAGLSPRPPSSLGISQLPQPSRADSQETPLLRSHVRHSFFHWKDKQQFWGLVPPI